MDWNLLISALKLVDFSPPNVKSWEIIILKNKDPSKSISLNQISA